MTTVNTADAIAIGKTHATAPPLPNKYDSANDGPIRTVTNQMIHATIMICSQSEN